MISILAFLGGSVILACQKKIQTDAVKVSVKEEVRSQPVDPILQELMVPTELKVPEHLRRDWPFVEWSYAKAYTYNFSNEMRKIPRYAWSDKGWADTIQETIELNKEQADVALELINRTGGGLIMTKCPIVPRHAVVFFNDQDQPVGSMNICFSCEDSVSWPVYYESQELEYSRYDLKMEKDAGEKTDDTGYEARYLLDVIHMESIANWQRFFDHVGASSYKKSTQ
jgi:hypothetical protein